ncbi:hypothetical protein LJC21_00460 [Bacteroides sp. OttesenSCG-928-E20]|nr:hypothetical protein [Bacteroides sp. OttesenSCG-928-E20]MDL2304652.1 hypothetical protein [Bacteroides sp. OttesenSCG-928-D19]
MEKHKYLYGVSIQGIQSFIFQTNELKDIVGASELVEKVCREKFQQLFEKEGVGYKPENLVMAAAGNIKYVFESVDDCEKIVRVLPKEIMEMATGITVSQAVVMLEEDDDGTFGEGVKKLEKKLKEQRNRPMPSMTVGMTAMARSPKTGLPAVCNKKGNLMDEATAQKQSESEAANNALARKVFGENVDNGKVAYNIDHMTDKNDWIAIIHIDGNSLGKVVSKIGNDRKAFSKFSRGLSVCTEASAVTAYNAVKPNFKNSKKIPIRPIVLGGDDHTLICRADLAMNYARTFIETFEVQTGEKLQEVLALAGLDRLTACAGIAFIKSSYPFYFGYDLSEALCKKAKKTTANEPVQLSSIMFHKVQDSFVESFDDIAKRELIVNDNESFMFGPYFVNCEAPQGYVRIEEFGRLFKLIKEDDKGGAAKSHLRQWLSVMIENVDAAEQKKDRLLQTLSTSKELKTELEKLTRGVKRGNKTHYMVYDLLSLHSVTYQQTKQKEEKA